MSKSMFALTLMLSVKLSNPSYISAEHAHIVNTFHFEVAAPMVQVAPLFAPEAERRWAGD